MTTETGGQTSTCARCGRVTEHLFPREPEGQVCSSCYESLARKRPEWSRLEILGIAGLLIGSALIVLAIVALILRG